VRAADYPGLKGCKTVVTVLVNFLEFPGFPKKWSPQGDDTRQQQQHNN